MDRLTLLTWPTLPFKQLCRVPQRLEGVTDRGEEVALGGSQRPPRPVDEVDRVEVVVERRLEAGRPTPIIDM